MRTIEAERTRSRQGLILMIGLALVAVVAPAVIAHHYGALDIPRSDDWSYLHTMFLWHRTGRWDFNDWVSMTLVGQVVASTPVLAVFGESITAISIAWSIVGFFALLAVVRLGRTLDLTTGESFVVVFAIAASPLWVALAPTFMTDVPAFAFEMFALALGAVALRRDSLPLLVGATALGFVAISIRQYAAIPVGVLLLVAAGAALARGDLRRVRAIAAVAATLGVAVVALLVWWSHVPNGKSLGPRVPNVESVRLTVANAANFLRLTGIVLLPAVVLAGPGRVVRRAWSYDRAVARRLFGGSAALLVVGYLLASNRPFVGNYFDLRGVLSNDIVPGFRPPIMPTFAFDVLTLLGTLSAIVVVLAAVPGASDAIRAVRARRLDHPDPVVATLGCSVAGFTVAYELATLFRMGFSERTAVFDRYLLPVIPLVGILVLRTMRQRPAPAATEPARADRRPASAVAVLVVLTLVGFAYAAESASFDGTRWKVANEVVARGYSPLQIHAGYEWEGWFRGRGPLTADTVAERQQLRAAYFEGMCVTISIAPKRMPPDPIAVAESTAPTRRPAEIVAARNTRSCAVPAGLGRDGEQPIRASAAERR